jgi:hypothetical protein
MSGYPNRFCSTNQEDSETEADLKEDGMNMWSQNRWPAYTTKGKRSRRVTKFRTNGK